MKQPKALYLLNFVSMWECFSYYGMRALLVLYMVNQLGFSDAEAFALYALYTSLVEFGGPIGGVVADRLLGLRRSIMLGSLIITIGHLAMAIPRGDIPFFLGLGLIVAGTGLFRSNTAAFLGEFYAENDPRREAGYTLYYTFINVGGFLASICCGIVVETYGWHAGFGLAGIGMLTGNLALLFGQKLLEGKGEFKQEEKERLKVLEALGISLLVPLSPLLLFFYQYTLPLFPCFAIIAVSTVGIKMRHQLLENRLPFKKFGLFIALLVLFYACEEQLGSTLMLFIERHVDRETSLLTLPVSAFVTFNPLTILVVGSLLSPLLSRSPLSGLMKMGISFFSLAIAYGILCLGCMQTMDHQLMPAYYAILSIVVVAFGEIFIGPTAFAAASEAAPKNLKGLTMGMVMLGFSFANLLSGYLSQLMAVENQASSLVVYLGGFALITSIGAVIGLVLTITSKKVVLA